MNTLINGNNIRSFIRKHVTSVIVSTVALVLFLTVSATMAQTSTVTLAGGDTLDVSCDGLELQAEQVSTTEQKLTCVPHQTPTETPVSPTATPVPPTGVQSFTPSDDAQVRSNRPDRNHGDYDSLRLRAGDPAYNSYLKFEVTGLVGDVQSAKLRLYVTDSSRDGGTIYLVSNDYISSTTPWTEGEITWANAPAMDGAPLSSIGSIGEQAWVEYDVTAAISGNGIYSFGLTNDSSDSAYFNAKEAGANIPTLVIELGEGAPPPAPTTGPTAVPTQEPTNTPEPTAVPTQQPTNTPEPSPTTPPTEPTPLPLGDSDFGTYPDCIAPAIGVETHSWWREPGDVAARHLHLGACAPNARDLNGDILSYQGDNITLIARVVTFNNPGQLYRVRADIYDDNPDYSDCPGGITCVSLPDLTCGANPSSGWDVIKSVGEDINECHKFVELVIPLDKVSGGLKEFRLSPFVRHEDLDEQPLQFATSNFQIHLAGSGSNYRSYTDPESRSWYEKGFEYTNARWVGYMGFFDSLNESIPTLSGVVDIEVKHTQCSEATSSSRGYINPPFHGFHAGTMGEPVPFYDKDGCFNGTVTLDTTTLSNGIHAVYLQTQEEGSQGMNAGAAKYFIRVEN